MVCRARLLAVITRTERYALLAETEALYVREHALFSLGFSGLTARELAALIVRNVTLDGAHALHEIVVPQVDGRRPRDGAGRRVPIADYAQRAVARYLTFRRGACAHFRLPLRTTTDASGVERCLSCDEMADFLAAPLFKSRQADGMTARQIRNAFVKFRSMLKLNPALTFDSLREWNEGGRHDGGGPATEAA
jgi:site-specific recombinase XerC